MHGSRSRIEFQQPGRRRCERRTIETADRMTDEPARCVMRVLALVALLAVVAPSVGCSRGPLKVATIQVGRSLNSDNSVATITMRFRPSDTMYASVITEGPGAGTLSVRWLSGGRVLTEEKKDVRYTDRAATEFHMNFAGGFPPGQYRVELFLDGEPIGARDLTVEN
jgi:hypothetical protein